MAVTKHVLRLADNFFDKHSPDAIDRQQRLLHCLVLVSLFYATLCMAFLKMSQLEGTHKRLLHADPNVSFELMIAPKDPPVQKIVLLPPQVAFVSGKTKTGGKEEAAIRDEKTTIPLVKAEKPVENPVKPQKQVSRHIPIPAPTDVITENESTVLVKEKKDPTTANLQPREEQSNSPINGGNPIDNANGVDPGNNGKGGTGGGSNTSIGSGNLSGWAGGREISTTIGSENKIAKGDIAPYRKQMLINLAALWRPSKRSDHVVVRVKIAQDGSLIDTEAVEASSRKALDRAVEAINAMKFEKLPDWFHGEFLTFRITLDKATLFE